MAVRKTRNFLPTVFQTDTNEKFLSATMDQLISEPVLTNLYGYIGRKFAPTYVNGDNYITESAKDRQDYQLEPATVVRDDQNKVTFFSSYVDFLNKIEYYGGFTNNQSRLFSNEYYSYDPLISFDKLVNFSQYYWLPNGPDAVNVNTTGIELTKTYNVTRDVATGRYIYTSNGDIDNSITLARGGVYKFIIDQPGYPFWIQSELGTDGRINATPTISSRDVFGVENNGTDSGTITFSVPQITAQSRFVSMPTVASVDYATPLAFSDLDNNLLSRFKERFPQYAGITGGLDGKLLVFVDQNQFNNRGEEIWISPNVIFSNTTIINGGITGSTEVTLFANTNISANLTVSGLGVPPGTTVVSVSGANITLSSALTANTSGVYTFTSAEYAAGAVVNQSDRYSVWKALFVDVGATSPLLKLVPYQQVAIDQKVFIKYGITNAGKEYYKDYDEFLKQTPLLSSLLDTIFVQDEKSSKINTSFKIVDYAGWSIDVEADILGKQNYTSPNGVQFTSGLKIEFDTDVIPSTYQNRQFYVEGVGNTPEGIVLVPVDELVIPELYNDENALNYPGEYFPEYITIVRSSIDRNPWSRNNRWFHREVIESTAKYRGEIATYNQKQRAQRPIIQFESNILLFNNGRIGKSPIDILDTTTQDAFDQYEGQILDKAFGVTLVDGMRVIFAGDQDPLVRNKIYILNLVQYEVDALSAPSGSLHIKLTKADDGDVETYDSVVVTTGGYKGTQWWYNGSEWVKSQEKTQVQQEPLFDVYDSTYNFSTNSVDTGKSLSAYNRSTFAGTKIFGYLKSSAGINDSVLGFPLSYRNFQSQGDIEFENYFTTDTFDQLINNATVTKNISEGFLQKINSRYELNPKNIWQTVVEQSKQYQNIGYIYDGTSNIFPIDVTPKDSVSVPYIKVFKNFEYLSTYEWILVSNQIRLTVSQIFIGDGTTTDYRLTNVTSTANGVLVLINGIPRKATGLYGVSGLVISFNTAPKQGDIIDIRVIDNPNIGDKIDILIFSDEVSELGSYQIPLNLDLNAQNTDIETLTLGQMRNHLVELGQNSVTLVGDVLALSNLRDIDIKQQGGTILQHSAPVPYGELFLLDPQVNFVDSIRYAQREYTKFKNKFLELSVTLTGINPSDPVTSVDLIMAEINSIKNTTFPWFYSDMVPYGTLKNTITYTIFNPLDKDYEITNIFSDSTLSNQAIVVYLNDNQLIKDRDYIFRTDRPAVTINVDLNVDDTLVFVEYNNTNGSYVPETPTKLGLWPKYIPEKFFDTTYRDPIDVIRGHDGSITPAFNDYRDDFLLELEKRIFNNIKVSDDLAWRTLTEKIPGKFRDTAYTRTEFTQLVTKNFQNWVGSNGVDFSTNSTFEGNDLFTWNYSTISDRIDGEKLPGSWRACYQYFYDTVYPHLFPWEMLGFRIKPDWWETYYGPAPYTSGNQLLWQDLEAGRIRLGPRAGINELYTRPGLTTIIPVDENGNLLPPAALLTANYNATRTAGAWGVGQVGPVEYAWRSSSNYPYAAQIAMALAYPAYYFGINIDTSNYTPYNPLYRNNKQFLISGTNNHLTQQLIHFNGETVNGTVYRTSGYLNWIADHLTSQGISPVTKLRSIVQNYEINLAYKLSGFTDKSYLNVLAEQTSPGSTNNTIVIPNENYIVHLNKSTPVQKITYSAVIVEKNTNGYSVKGYDLNNPFFTIIPSVINSNASKITVLNKSATIYRDYQNLKLVVPYGYEFTSLQQVVDFLISYERYLKAQGVTFTQLDEALATVRNWSLSVKEFLYWAQQGWKPGSILVLSPVANVFTSISIQSITDGVSDSQYGSRIIDQNFKLVRNSEYEVLRGANNFKVTLNNPASVIAFIEIDLVQYEHVLVFDNTTVFNDIIYKPESGNRQYRLKLQGQKSAEWDGSLYAPGFIYSNNIVPTWQSGRDYLKGDLIEYKNQFYTALQDIVASVDFQFGSWQPITSSEIKSGLLPNFSLLASESKAYYDSYPSVDSKKQIEYSHGLIGFKPRQYLSDLGLTTTTQIEFYKGFIRQKGTLNAINELTTATFKNLSSNISLYEEYAMRVGTYGALDINPFVEIALDEKTYGVNPSLARFVGAGDNNLGNGLDVFNKSQLYKSTDYFTGNIALNRTANSNYDNDIKTAGYVNINDVDATIFDLTNYIELNNELSNIGTGYLIWVAKDFDQDWNVFRVTETNNSITTVTNSLDGYIQFTSTLPHNLVKNDIFLIRGFDPNFDGFYQVSTVSDLNNVVVKYSGSTENLTTLYGLAPFYVLNSMRFRYMEDSRIYGLTNPPNGWKVGDKIWIDVDAETTAVQGQPFGTQPNNTWKVYEKTHPWTAGQSLKKRTSEYVADDGFGSALKMSADNQIIVTGSPWVGNGVVNSWYKNYLGEFEQAFNISAGTSNVYQFGSTVDLSIDNTDATRLVVGAPASYGNVGFVMTYVKSNNSDTFMPSQIITGETADKFGTSLAFNEDGSWLYIGAPGNDKIYLYGLDKTIKYHQDVVSVNNQNIIALANLAGSGSIIANVGDILSEPITGAAVRVVETTWPSSSSNIKVSSLTGIIPSPGQNKKIANITLSGNVSASVGSYIYQYSSGANISLIKGAAGSTQIYGVYQTTNKFDTTGNITINGGNVAVKPTVIQGANLFLNGADIGFYANLTYTSANISNIELSFTPSVSSDASSLLVTSGSRVFIPNIDYIITNPVPSHYRVQFIANGNVAINANVEAADYIITQQPYYRLLGNLTNGNAGSNFGYALSSSFDGAQIAVGAPNDTVYVGNIAYPGAGAVYVYDRVIEAFDSTGLTTYTTQNTIADIYRVLIDGVEVLDYTKTGPNTIEFNTPPPIGKVIYVEVNQFVILEKIIGVDDLFGGTKAIQANAAFGTSLTICSNNCAIYIGAPNYDNGTEFNTGAVWKFHNRGRLYGTNNGYAVNPVFTPGDSIRLDNFEVTVSARMMPTIYNGTTANILALSSNVRANVGDVINQYLGSGYYANVTVLANTSVVGSQFITVTDYTTANVFNYGQSTPSANVIRVGSTVTSAYPMVSLDSLVKDINDANLLGITAANENNYLRLTSDVTVAKNKLRILSGITTSGSQGVLLNADMIVFAFMQIIVNPFNASGEYFGTKVKLAANAYMLVIGSARGSTKGQCTFDNGTTIVDSLSTIFIDTVKGSGSVYIYELYDDPRDEVENPGRYSYCQQLDPGNLHPGDQFGYALDIEGTYIVIGAPEDSATYTNAGAVYVFQNLNQTRGWELIRYQQPTVDVDSVTRLFLYDNQTNIILDNLQFIDPAKGRILGQAEQEITYKTEFDPAVYNRGTRTDVNITSNQYWNNQYVNRVWWDLSSVRFIDYEQDTLTYRSINWGSYFPGSTIELFEWTESNVLPSQYTTSGYNGVPKYADDSAYVEIVTVDPVSNIIISKYYYWVTGKTIVDPNDPNRSLPISAITDIIENPKNQGIAYGAVIRNDAIILYNVGPKLSAQNTIMHLDYQLAINTDIIHSEYELVQKGNPATSIPSSIVDKMIDSLAGLDSFGATVPDPKLSVADRYGIDIRPRQSMFVDRLAAVSQLVTYVNSILTTKPVARQYDLTKLKLSEPEPSLTLGECDQIVNTVEELTYLDTGLLATGYLVLVKTDTTQANLWVLYELQINHTWAIKRVQSYNTNLYWNYVDWYAEGFGPSEVIEFVVDTLPDALKLPISIGDEVLVKVAAGPAGGWNLLTVANDGTYQVVGIQNGTIQFSDSLSNFENYELGFGNQAYASNRYDQNPNLEIRNIIRSLQEDIFINELQGEFNNLVFVMINYLFSEQKYVDWIFKTSFVSATHRIRSLEQFPSYIADNQTYYQNYIEEVKPYRTKIREYLLNYSGNDVYQSTVTDFDLPAYYDSTVSKSFRSPNGEQPEVDEAKWQTYPYSFWYDNRKFAVGEILIEEPGEGYTTAPLVQIISSGGGGSGATAEATIDSDTGAVIAITITNEGSGYTQVPDVVINGSGTVSARAYAILINRQIRTFNTSLKFDRITYGSKIIEWSANTSYTATTFDENGYWLSGNVISHVNAEGIRIAYTVNSNFTSGNTFVVDNLSVYSTANIKTANDRIMGYYQPSASMITRDLNQLVDGIEYPGVQIIGSNYNITPEYGAVFDIGTYDNLSYDSDGTVLISEQALDTIIQSTYADAALGTRPEDIDIDGGQYVDRYSSHAPEELVPGITFDTLDMRVYTQNNDNIWGYRVFKNMLRETSYLRIADNYTTSLANALSLTDNFITVEDSSSLPIPDPTFSRYPGVVFIGAERITYWKNYANSMTHWTPNVSYPVDSGLFYGNVVTFSNAITANAGDVLIESLTGNAAIVTKHANNQFTVPLFYINESEFTLGTGNINRIDETNLTIANVISILNNTNIMIQSANLSVGQKIEFSRNFGNISGNAFYYITSVSDVNTATSTSNIRITDEFNGSTFSNLIAGVYSAKATVSTISNLSVYPTATSTAYYISTSSIDSGIFDYANVVHVASPNILGQIRRGTQGTATINTYPIGTLVTDASVQQQVPGMDTVDVKFTQVQFSNPISANIGDYITQPITNFTMRVINTASSTSNVSVTYQGEFALRVGQSSANANVIILNGNVTSVYPVGVINTAILTRTITSSPSYAITFSNAIQANVGDTITQVTSGANATVLAYETANVLIVNYNSAAYFDLTTGNVVANSNVAINGTYTGNIYPIISNIAGFVGNTIDGGNVTVTTSEVVTIKSNTRLQQSNVWLSNIGLPDGTGLAGSTTQTALFIKAELAILNATNIKPDELTTEDAINTLTTESGIEITEE